MAGEPSQDEPVGMPPPGGTVATPIKDPEPIVVPGVSMAAFPTNARSPIWVRRNDTQPEWKVAPPAVAISATKLSLPRVSRSGSRCATVDTSAPRPTRAPNDLSHGTVYKVA